MVAEQLQEREELFERLLEDATALESEEGLEAFLADHNVVDADARVLLDIAMTRNDSALQAHIELVASSLAVCSVLNLCAGDLRRLLSMLATDVPANCEAVVSCLAANAHAAMEVFPEAIAAMRPKARSACARAVRICGLEHADLWERARTLLCTMLSDGVGDREGNGRVLGELIVLHGMDRSEADGADVRTPSKETLASVRACFEADACDPTINGGYIDFLERASIPADPSDRMVQSLAANARPAPDGSMETAQALHRERLEDLRQHWAYLHRLRRAQGFGRTATKAVILFALLLVFEFFNSKYGPLAQHNRQHGSL